MNMSQLALLSFDIKKAFDHHPLHINKQKLQSALPRTKYYLAALLYIMFWGENFNKGCLKQYFQIQYVAILTWL